MDMACVAALVGVVGVSLQAHAQPDRQAKRYDGRADQQGGEMVAFQHPSPNPLATASSPSRGGWNGQKYSFLPERIKTGFPATPSGTNGGDFQPWP